MSTNTHELPGSHELPGRLGELSASGQAAGGLVSVELGGTGAVRELSIEPKAMRMASTDLAAALKEALSSAHASLQEQLSGLAASFAPGEGEIEAQLEEIGADARNRLEELTGLAHQVADRLNRHS